MFWLTGLALLLALGHAALATLASREKSTTADELAHVTGGYTFNHWHDYRLHPENGILPQRWQALPATLSDAVFPPLTTTGWRHSVVWLVGYDFFFESRNDPARLLLTARAMNSLFGAATVLVVFFWSRRLWGTPGAVVSAVFCALCPTMLAHSGLATSDMCMALFFLVFPAAYWRHLQDGRARSWWLSAMLLGLAAVAKFTAVLLLPMVAVMAVVRALWAEPLVWGRRTFNTPDRRLGAIAVSTVGQGLVALLVIWAFFGFRYSLFNPALPGGEPNLSWELLLNFGGWKAAFLTWCREWRLLPEGWLYGLGFVLQHAQARAAFLDGDYGIFGWVEFFPKAFLYKSPLPLLTGLLAGTLLLGLRLRGGARAQLAEHLYRVTPLLVLFGVYWLFSLTSHLNIGHRHILPTYPVLYVFCGILGWAAARAWRKSRPVGWTGAAAVTTLLAWQVAVAAGIHPHYLAYFSPVVGGPTQGYRHLVDSSLDWGQDLPGLGRWLDTHRQTGEPVYVSYFGSDEPVRFVHDAVLMPRLGSFDRKRPWYWCEPGIYAISATMLQQVYMPERADWNHERETRYQQLRLNDEIFRALHASPGQAAQYMGDIPPAQWHAAWDMFEQLRFARLCQYLRARPPDAMAGYSILIFRLTEEELADALGRDVRALAAAIERARAGPEKP